MPPRPSRSKLSAIAPPLPDAAGVLAALPEAVLVVDAGWRLAWANPAAQALLGGALGAGSDVRGEALALLGLAEHLDVGQPADTLAPTRFSHRPPPPARCFEVQVQPLGREGLVLHVREDTERVRREGELRENLGYLRAVMDGAQAAAFTKDLQGRYLFVNGMAARLLGRPLEEVGGHDDNALLPPERARVLLEHDRQVLATERTLTFEHAETVRGRRRVYYTIEGVLRDEAGKVTGLWGICHDITAFKEAEAQLTLQTERLRLSMEAARIGTWDWDLLERKVYWSGDVAAIAGLPPEGVESSYAAFFDRVVAEDRALLAQRIAAAVQERTGFDVEFRVASAGKPPRWLRGKGWVLSDGTRAVRMLGALMDVTHEKLAQEDARRLGEFQEQLVGIVSHDIRSPLGAIISWTRMLEQGLAGEELPRTVSRISLAARRIERLTHLLLDFTRARLGGGIPLSPRRTNIHELVRRIGSELRASHPTRQLVWEQEGDGAGYWDPDRLAQVLANLMDNALKYGAADRPVRITVRGTNGWVLLRVHNHGKPIEPHMLPIIFEPFRQGKQSAQTARVSYGLGLYIAREIVRGHGGTIEVESSAEEGTSFRVSLPRQPPTVAT